ncbi:DNA gyrase/topoisomerase IV subunit A [Bacillus wiedmannii]|uniref:DNA gyrase/topoisomerase IV subunit A n=1 Tax=Bacillus wiedmannii TaxID=1890302 RepID=UPI000BFCF3D2|nr:DNA topoisomerase (ATP-hydrolyzing) subunit A [Bacillus wiedmannii]PHA62841.1 DNA topoisomerase [Bacillus wiedmannii]
MTTTNKNLEHIVQNNMMEYASYVLLDRCLPSLEDGLKPVHRRILYAMHVQKAFKLTKSANVAGYVMRYHPHGSSYGSMVGMVQKDRHSVPMLIGKGNFGMYTSRDLAPAADRYSEVKLSDIAVDMMQNFDKNIVDFIDNYDGTMKMPEVLPVKFPAILAYAQSGIGVGFSSSSPSFNMVEICEAFEKYILTGEKTILAPDFATGGSIVNEPEVFNQINQSGRGTVKIRGKAEVEGNEILITEIPYSTTREAIIEKIVELAKSGKLKEVSDVKDLTGLKGMLVSVTARRGTDMDMLLEKLYRFTPLQSTFSANMNILVDDLPKVLGVWDIADKWLVWRRDCIKRGLTYDIKKMTTKLHILRGLEKVLLDIDKAIEIIRFSKEDLIEKSLQAHFNIDEEQSKEISNMKLRNINKEYILRRIQEITKLEEKIESYKDILKDESKLNLIVIKGLNETKEKFGKARRTQIIEVSSAPVVRLTQEVPSYPVWIHLTKEGYCYKFRGTQQPTLKPGDEVIRVFETKNDAEILVFNSDRTCHKIEIKRIDETRVTSLGTFLPNMMRTENVEIVSYSVLDEKHTILVAAYTNNRLAKINLKSFSGNRRILKNAFNLRQDLVDLVTLTDEAKLKIITDRTEVEVDTTKLALTNSRGATGVYTTRKGEMKRIEVA